MSNSHRPLATEHRLLRRVPKQDRSHDRVAKILKVSANLIGERGIDAVTMKEIGSRSGGPIASVYQYFPEKAAILQMLYERHIGQKRVILANAIATISIAEDAMAALNAMIDAYYDIMREDSSALDVLNAIKASKLLGKACIAETRRQADDFYNATIRFVKMNQREHYKNTLFLLFNMADANVRLTLMALPSDRFAIMTQFKSLVRAQAGYYLARQIPDAL